MKRKLEALNYDGDLDPKSAPLAEKLVDDLLNATNSYKSLKLRLTKQSKAQDNWEAKLMTLKQEKNAALLEENSQLRLQLIHNDELCDEKLRRAFAESCKLQRSVTELKFWKEQAIQRNVQFERLHDEIRVDSNLATTRLYQLSRMRRLVWSLPRCSTQQTSKIIGTSTFSFQVQTTVQLHCRSALHMLIMS